jgi:hypothetical protein
VIVHDWQQIRVRVRVPVLKKHRGFEVVSVCSLFALHSDGGYIELLIGMATTSHPLYGVESIRSYGLRRGYKDFDRHSISFSTSQKAGSRLVKGSPRTLHRLH